MRPLQRVSFLHEFGSVGLFVLIRRAGAIPVSATPTTKSTDHWAAACTLHNTEQQNASWRGGRVGPYLRVVLRQ